MPRSTGQSIPKYRKHRASGQAVCTLNGRDYYLGPHGTRASRLEYDRLVAEWLAAGRNAPGNAHDGLTIDELCLRYLKFARGYYQRDGKCTGEVPGVRSMIRALRRLYRRQPCCEFGPLALKAVREQLISDRVSRPYINAQVARIKRMFKWGVSEQLVPVEVHQALATVGGLRRGKTEARETAPVLPVDDAIVDATLPFLSPVVADMVRFQRLTGCRPGEVCQLRPCDLDRSSKVWIYTPPHHKTEHHGLERVIPVGPKAQVILLRYLARDAQTYCFRPCDSEKKRLAALHATRTTPLNCGNKPGSNRKRKPKQQPGECYDSQSYWRAVRYACDRAFPHPTLSGIKKKDLSGKQLVELRKWQKDHHWSPNQLRHAAATEIRREFGLEAAQVVLGHSRADVTQVYAERDLQKGLEIALQIG